MNDRHWTELLPEVWRDNPVVLVIMAPEGSRGTIEETADGAHVGVLITPRGTRRCLQVIDPPLVGWIEHEQVAERNGMQMAHPEYIGPLNDVPDHFLLATLRYPLLYRRDELHAPPLNLRNYVRSLTTTEQDGN